MQAATVESAAGGAAGWRYGCCPHRRSGGGSPRVRVDGGGGRRWHGGAGGPTGRRGSGSTGPSGCRWHRPAFPAATRSRLLRTAARSRPPAAVRDRLTRVVARSRRRPGPAAARRRLLRAVSARGRARAAAEGRPLVIVIAAAPSRGLAAATGGRPPGRAGRFVTGSAAHRPTGPRGTGEGRLLVLRAGRRRDGRGPGRLGAPAVPTGSRRSRLGRRGGTTERAAAQPGEGPGRCGLALLRRAGRPDRTGGRPGRRWRLGPLSGGGGVVGGTARRRRFVCGAVRRRRFGSTARRRLRWNGTARPGATGAEVGLLGLGGPQVVDPPEFLGVDRLLGGRLASAAPPAAPLRASRILLLRPVFRPLRLAPHWWSFPAATGPP